MKQTFSPYISTKQILNEQSVVALRRKIFERRPQLKYILEKYGNMTLYDFAMQRNIPYSITLNRKSEFIDTFSAEVERLLGKETAESCAQQLATVYRVATTDHHGPLSEPGMVNSNIHEALPYLEGDEIVKNIIVLGCANVSFDNESFPRGLLFHGDPNHVLTTNQLTFYPRSVRARPVINFPAYTAENIANSNKLVALWARDERITQEESNELSRLLEDIYANPKVLESQYFSEQVTKTNYKLWEKLMMHNIKAPKLIYIEQEGIVNTLLKKYHLSQDTLINRILFTPKYHELLVKHFDQIDKGFSLEERRGTYLFWAVPTGQKYRVQLWKQGDYLQTEDGSYKVALTPEGIKAAIDKKELIPSTLMSFILLSFYYGVKLTGGTNQTTYLTQMKQAFIKMQQEYGDNESVKYVKQVPTTDLSVAVQSLAFIKGSQDELIPATGIDLLLYGNKATLETMQRIAKTLTVNETFYRAFPDCYGWYYSQEERDPALAAITKADMEKYLHIQSKITSSAEI